MLTARSSRLFYGWIIVAGAFLSFAVSAGILHSFTVFFVAFLDEFGWSRADASLAYALSQLLIGVSAPLIGVAVDRFGPRRLVLLGGTVLAIGLAASAWLTTLWQIIVLYGVVMTLGANCLGLLVSAPLVARWFVRKRGMAMAIVQSANGFGRALATPLVQALIAWCGWRRAYMALAVFVVLLVVPLSRCLSSQNPQDRGLTPDSLSPEVVPATTAQETGSSKAPREWSVRDAIRTPHLWLLFGVYLFTGLGSYFVSLHQLAFAVDLGFDRLYAATVLGLSSFLTIAGTITLGILSDYIGREITAIIAYGISIVGVAWALGLSGPDDVAFLWLHATCFALTWGARGPLITAKTADLFQGKNLGAIFGIISIGTGIGSAVGSWSSGRIFDLFGSYHLAFWLSIASYLGGCVTFWLLRRPPAR